MAPSIARLCALALVPSIVSATTLVVRRETSNDVQFYMMQVSSALEAIAGIRDKNASQACADVDYASSLDRQGYDGQLAQNLLYAHRQKVNIDHRLTCT